MAYNDTRSDDKSQPKNLASPDRSGRRGWGVRRSGAKRGEARPFFQLTLVPAAYRLSLSSAARRGLI
jgi:hypothetical protein